MLSRPYRRMFYMKTRLTVNKSFYRMGEEKEEGEKESEEVGTDIVRKVMINRTSSQASKLR